MKRFLVLLTTLCLTTMSFAIGGPTFQGNGNVQINPDVNNNLTFVDPYVGPITLSTMGGPFSGLPTAFPANSTYLGTVSTTTTIAPSATYMLIASSGGAVTIGQGLIPAIATTTASSGQFLILDSTSTSNAITISTGSVSCVYANATTVTLGSFKTIVLVFNRTLGIWKVLSNQ